MKTERDTLVTKAERHELEWLTPTTLCIAPSFIGGEPRELKIVELRDGVWTPRLVLLKSAPLAPGLDKTAAALADGVFAAFRAYRNAVSACDLHQIDKAQAKFSKARDILRQIQKKLPAGNVTGAPSQDGVCLTKNDLAPYLKEFSHEAGMTPTQRVDAIVRKNLRFSITRVLDIYVQEEQQMPESMDALARRALERGWIPGPAGAQRLVFLVPGESAEKMTTSYEIVSHDDAAGTLIVETTALPDGRRLRASFQRQSSTNGEDTTFKFPVITEVRPPETTPAR